MFNIFPCAYWPFVYLLWRNVYSTSWPVLNQLFVLLLLSFRNSLYILSFFTFLFIFFTQISFPSKPCVKGWLSTDSSKRAALLCTKLRPRSMSSTKEFSTYSEHDLLIWYLICKYCLPFGGLSLYAVDSVFLWWSFNFFLNKFNEPIFPFVTCASGFIPKKSLPNPMFWNFCPMLSSESFIGLGFTCTSLIHFELIFVHAAKCPASYFCCGYPILQHHLLKRLPFPH